MAPRAPVPLFSKDERVLCFHHDMLYEAKVLDCRQTEDNQSWQYRIHYKGWKNTWDDWVPQDRVRKFTDENKELAAQLHAQMKALQQKSVPTGKPSTRKGTRANGSDFSSARGSEERHLSTAGQVGRGPRRNRDYDLEQMDDVSDVDNARMGSPSVLSETESRVTVLSRTPTPPAMFSDFNISEQTTQTTQPFNTLQSRKGPADKALSPSQTLPPSKNRPRRVVDKTLGPSQISQSGKSDPRKRLSEKAPQTTRKDTKKRRTNNQNSSSSHGESKSEGVWEEPDLAFDYLVQRPASDHTYIENGKLKNPERYFWGKQPSTARPHPKFLKFKRFNQLNYKRILYYGDMPAKLVLPLAGIIRESHFDKLFHGQVLTNDKFQEEGFHQRPSIKLNISDHLKAILVDDWENVTKNQQLLPLPAAHPVNSILADYLAFEKPKRTPGSSQADILEEVVAGLKEYFDKCLGRILLYRFERNQYLELRELWNTGEGDWAGKGAGDTYGAEHLCRLLVTLPELIAQTNMDAQSVNRLREELSKLTNWLAKNAAKYFVNEYENPNQTYIEKARGF